MAVTDLTGYTWVGNSFVNTSNFSDNTIFNIDFYIPSDVISYYYGFRFFDSNYDGDPANALQYIISSNNYFGVLYNGVWNNNNAYKTIVITGGTDATNSTLISWLESNGTLTAPIVANTYTLTHSLTNLTKGNITIQITPDTGYSYPTTLSVTNGTLVSYDNTTGIAVISGDDTTIVSGECVASVSEYEVQFTASGNWYSPSEGAIEICDGQDDTGTRLLYQSPANKSAFPMTLTVTSGYCYIHLIGAFIADADITSDDYYIGDSGSYVENVIEIDKDGAINLMVADFDD